MDGSEPQSGRGYRHGFGTGEEDVLYEYKAQASKGLLGWIADKFKGLPFFGGRRSQDGRTVTYESRGTDRWGRPRRVVVTVRDDPDDPHPETAGSIDTSYKIETHGRPTQAGNTHFGYKKR